MRISCIKSTPKLVGKGLHRRVYKVRGFVLKLERGGGGADIKTLHRKAVGVDAYQRAIREDISFLPKYFGTVITIVETDAGRAPTIITVHEHVKPLSRFSPDALRGILKVLSEAYRKHYFLDPKLSNFGKKGGLVFYLDEYGVGKRPIPPDVLDDLGRLVRAMQRKLKMQ